MDDDGGGGKSSFQRNQGGGGGGGGGGAGNGPEFRSRGNAKMPHPNYAVSHGVDGPWNNRPLVGSLYKAQRLKEAGAASRERKEYPYKSHPTFAKKDGLEPSPGSQCSEEEHLRKALNNISGVVYPNSSDPDDPSLDDQANKDFLSGDVTWKKAKGDRPLWFYHACLMIPRVYLKDDASHLLDFRTDDKNSKVFGQMACFVMKAFSNNTIGTSASNVNGVALTDFIYCGKIHPRMRVFVEVILTQNAGGLRRHLARDPETQAEADAFRSLDPAIVYKMYGIENIVGFRFHWVVFDPRLHPAAMIKYQIFHNQFEKNIIDWNKFVALQDHHLHASGFQEYVAEKKKEKASASFDEQKGLEKERMDGGFGAAPHDRAAAAGEAVAKRAETDGPAESDVDMESAEEEEEEENSDDEVSGIEEGEPRDSDIEAEEAKAALEEMEGGGGKKKAARVSDKKKKNDFIDPSMKIKHDRDPTRAVIGHASQEIDPTTYYRLILDFTKLSLRVFHVYNSFANTPMSKTYSNGLYEADPTLLRSHAYDMHTAASPMFYLKTFSLAPSIRLAQHHVPGHVGKPMPILAEQSAFESYRSGPNKQLSFPFPSLVYEYNTSNPEFLEEYRLPCGSSQISDQVAMLNARVAEHAMNVSRATAKGTLVSRFANCSLASSTKKTEEEIECEDIRERHFSTAKKAKVAEEEEEKELTIAEYTQEGNLRSLGVGNHHPKKEGFDLLARTKFSGTGEGNASSAGAETRQSETLAKAKLHSVHTARRRMLASGQSELAEMLDTIIQEAEPHFGKDTFAPFLHKLLKDSPEAQKVIDSMITNTFVSADSAREYRAIFRDDRQLKQDLEESLRLMGDAAEEVRAKLSTHVLEGPIAKLRHGLNKLKFDTLRTVSMFPLKTEKEDLASWLEETIGWKRPESGDLMEAVLKEMTFEREEQYRRDMLSKLMPMFQKEACTLLMSEMQLVNRDLPDSILGLLHFKEERKSNKFLTPRYTWDPTLTRFANMMAIDLAEIDQACSLTDGHVILLNLLHSNRINAMIHGKKLAQSNIFFGGPGVGKSHVVEEFTLLNCQSSVVGSQYESKLSNCVAKAHDYFNLVHDEGPEWIVGDAGKMNPAARAEREMKKAQLTQGAVSFQRNVEGKNGEREKQSVNVSYRHQVIVSTNKVAATAEKSVLDRFRVQYFCPVKLRGDSVAIRVVASHLNEIDDSAAKESLIKNKKDEHYLLGLAVSLQNVFAIPPTNTEVMAVYMHELQAEMARWLDYKTITARSIQRAWNDVEAYVFSRLHDVNFRSEASPVVNWSKDPKTGATDGRRIESIEAITPLKLVDYFSSGMCVQAPEALFALTNYFNEVYPLRYYEIALVIACEVFDFTPDFFLPSYDRANIPRPNVTQRAAERGETGDPYETCGFLAEYRERLDKLRASVARRNVNNRFGRCMPKFARVSDLEGRRSEANRDDKKKWSGKGKQAPVDESSAQDRLFVPSVLAWKGEWKTFGRKAMTALVEYFPHMEDQSLLFILNELAEMKITVPWYEPTNAPRADTLSFSGVQYHDGRPVTDNHGALKGLQYRRMSVLEYQNSDGVVKFAVDFFMRPWHEVLYLSLSAPETADTREFDTLIPIQLEKHPRLIHRWSSRKNPHHTVVLRNPRVIPKKIAESFDPSIYSGFTHHLDEHSAVPVEQSTRPGAIKLEGDFEQKAFARHLLSIHCTPPNFERVVDEYPQAFRDNKLDDWTNIKDPLERAERFAKLHVHAPGATEGIIRVRHKTFPFYKGIVPRIRYPEDIRDDLEQLGEKAEAVEFAEDEIRRRTDQKKCPRDTISIDQARELRKQFEAEPDSKERKYKLDNLDVWLYARHGEVPLNIDPGEWEQICRRHHKNLNDAGFYEMFWRSRLRKYKASEKISDKNYMDEYLKTIGSAPPPAEEEKKPAAAKNKEEEEAKTEQALRGKPIHDESSSEVPTEVIDNMLEKKGPYRDTFLHQKGEKRSERKNNKTPRASKEGLYSSIDEDNNNKNATKKMRPSVPGAMSPPVSLKGDPY